MGNKAAIALFGMSGILILFATYTSLLPDVVESKAQIEINSSKSQLIHYLSSAKDWDEWLFTEQEFTFQDKDFNFDALRLDTNKDFTKFQTGNLIGTISVSESNDSLVNK